MEPLAYDEYAHNCIHEIHDLQSNFRKDFHIDDWENWFYDQASGLFTFSTGDEEINFRYCDVGSFSTKSNTWKWSWDNDHILAKVKEQTLAVKEFGETMTYEKLTTGCFNSTKEEGWEFTSITAKILEGIGVYRPVSEHLMLFMVILEFVDNDTAQIIKDKYIECGSHEKRRRAFVCRHLDKTTKAGFEEAFETYEGMELSDEDEDEDFQAWCDECEIVRQNAGGWNDESMKFADIKMVCEACYFEMKTINLEHK
ncbi:DUF6882 domain-containing protein [Pinibacter soli]|uniref:Uncharacterized protein n=1 Tax=Pinibacter soli TaxID=3044211 RepID=A0ABT6RAP6_9BACT|nr:DUF6882 domain-containing protein [Pinibacter soli]MDI3319631.1 hypothetical protein [Pinibacter soli]